MCIRDRLLALAVNRGRTGLAWLNLANGDLRLMEIDSTQLPAQLERLRPAALAASRPQRASTNLPAGIAVGSLPIASAADVTALITERGVCPASEAGLLGLFPERA